MAKVLTTRRTKILQVIALDGGEQGLSSKEIAKRIQKSPQGCFHALNQLVKQGYLTETADRPKRFHITEQGKICLGNSKNQKPANP